MGAELMKSLISIAQMEASKINPQLVVEDYFCCGAGSNYLVRFSDESKGSRRYVLKTPYWHLNRRNSLVEDAKPVYIKQISNELRALRLLKGFKYVTQLEEVYQLDIGGSALLKEYFPGKTIFESKTVKYKTMQERIRAAVEVVHNEGIADFDVRSSNLVLSDDGREFKFIDFGVCTFEDEVPKKTFKRLKRIDFENLEKRIFR